MILERRHLHNLLAIDTAGSLARAALRLHITQSALSHQIKMLENHYGIALFHRHTKPLRLTAAGHRLLKLAEQTLPLFLQAEQELERMASGDAGRLYLSIECHACFEWLMPVIRRFKETWPAVDMDIRLGLAFNSLPALRAGDIDLVITSDPLDTSALHFDPLFRYEGRLVMPATHALASKQHIEPADLRDQSLITYPVERDRMDVFKYFLQPAGIEPKQVRQTELTAIILLLVASNQGVAALPDWVMRYAGHNDGLLTRPLGDKGLHRTLFAAYRTVDADKTYLTDFNTLCRQADSLNRPTIQTMPD